MLLVGFSFFLFFIQYWQNDSFGELPWGEWSVVFS